jgi:dolichol-phosphate mannosyltransferase
MGLRLFKGLKSDRGKESAFHKLCSKIFYHAISHAIEMDMNNSSDFKLIDRKVINQLSSIKERDTFFRALSFWVGFKTTKVYFEVQDRVAGKSKWSISSLFKYALHNVSSYSYKPLYSILSFSFIFFVLSIIIGVDTLISYAHHCSVSGYPTLIFIILISSSFILFSLGIIGIYIAKIYDEVKGRPQYIIERVL